MKIHAYTLCHNEEILLPYYLRHYGPICERIVIMDDGSTDQSPRIARSHPKVELRLKEEAIGGDPRVYDEYIFLKFRNEAYKESRGQADWVIVTDLDEFLWCPDFLGTLERYKTLGITLPKVSGYDMISDRPPSGQGQIYDEIKYGFPSPGYSKREIFDPLIDIRFSLGGHTCLPKGKITESENSDIKLLHYRLLGENFAVEKYMTRIRRMRKGTVEDMFDFSPDLPESEMRERLKKLYCDSVSNGMAGKVVP